MDTYAHFFDKHDKKMVDTLEEIQGGGKVVENFFSGAELTIEKHDTVANTLTLVLLGFEKY